MPSRKITAIFFIVSIAVGVDYTIFYLLAGMEFHPTTQENWTNVLAVFIFTMAEGIGVWRLLRNQNDYMIWVMPAIADLFLKGIIAFLVFDNSAWLLWDSCRALLLLVCIQYDRCALLRRENTCLYRLSSAAHAKAHNRLK